MPVRSPSSTASACRLALWRRGFDMSDLAMIEHLAQSKASRSISTMSNSVPTRNVTFWMMRAVNVGSATAVDLDRLEHAPRQPTGAEASAGSASSSALVVALAIACEAGAGSALPMRSDLEWRLRPATAIEDEAAHARCRVDDAETGRRMVMQEGASALIGRVTSLGHMLSSKIAPGRSGEKAKV
jgi:hypothetical protein